MIFSWRRILTAIIVIAVAALEGRAQVELDNNFKFNSGQDIQPIFEGWSHTPDGGFAMHFGYLNRNYVQELSLPVGPANSIEPNGPDRGQPTYFYTRTQRSMFVVSVPKDWGKKELTWTITANGKTQKAIAWLQPEWEIDPVGGAATGGRTDDEYVKNKPPTLMLEPALTASVSAPLMITAKVTDDGLPKPGGAARKPAVGQETPPLLQGGSDAPVNVPQVSAAGGGGRQTGPTVTWIVWRGPGKAVFNPATVPVKDGVAPVSVSFSKPGDYVLRARASDRVKSTTQDVKVTVR